MTVRISFDYEPKEPDDDDRTGVSEDEFSWVSDLLMERFGAENIEIVRKDE